MIGALLNGRNINDLCISHFLDLMDQQLDIPVFVKRAALAADQGEQVLAVVVGAIGHHRPIVFDRHGKTTAEEAIVIGGVGTTVIGFEDDCVWKGSK